MGNDHSEFIEQIRRQLTLSISKKNLSRINIDSLEIISCANHWQRDNSLTNDDKRDIVELLNICGNDLSRIFLPSVYYLSFIDGFDEDVINLTYKNSAAINSEEDLYATVLFAGISYLRRSSENGVYFTWPKMVDFRNFIEVKNFTIINYYSKVVSMLNAQLNSGKITGEDIEKFYDGLPVEWEMGVAI